MPHSPTVAVLYVVTHFDPKTNVTAKEQYLHEVAALDNRVRPHYTFVFGDMNVHRSPKGLLDRVTSEQGVLRGLRIHYPKGESTHFTSGRSGDVSTEIDYILASKTLQLVSKGVYPGISTHLALTVDYSSFLGRAGQSIKRYKYRSTEPLSVCDVHTYLLYFGGGCPARKHTLIPEYVCIGG